MTPPLALAFAFLLLLASSTPAQAFAQDPADTSAPVSAAAAPLEALTQAPALPDGLCADPRMTWRPTLNPTAAVVVDEFGVVTVWRTGSPVIVPTNGRAPITVGAEQLKNNSGEWLGFYGNQGVVSLGKKPDSNDAARANGFQGVSFVGLDHDSHSSTGSVLGGFNLAQYVGHNRDIAFLNLTIDSWTNRPCTTAAHANPDLGHLYLERIKYLAIGRRAQGLTPKGLAVTTWAFRLEGHVRSHFLDVRMVGGETEGDGFAGTVEHGVYQNGPPGSSEFVDCTFQGAGISAVYFVTRFMDRIDHGTTWGERFGQGTLLLENLTAIDCGPNGSFAVNVCGGILDVVLRNYHYRVNRDTGSPTPAPWAGGAIQFYCDHKAYELGPPINSQSKPVALGYSLESSTVLPMSAGIQALVDAGVLPWDGYGSARSLTVIGGTFEVANLTPPLFSLRDVRLVTFQETGVGASPFTVSGLGGGKVVTFAGNGQKAQCGPAQAAGKPAGRVPAALGAGWNQQARFLSRRLPSTWIGGTVKIVSTTVPPADLDSWAWRP